VATDRHLPFKIVGADEAAAGHATVRDLRGDAGQRSVPRLDLVDEVAALLAPDPQVETP